MQTQNQLDLDFEIKNPCIDSAFLTWTKPVQATVADNEYDNVPYGWTYAPYTVTPSFCNLQKKCVSVDGPAANLIPCQEIAGDNTLSFLFD